MRHLKLFEKWNKYKIYYDEFNIGDIVRCCRSTCEEMSGSLIKKNCITQGKEYYIRDCEENDDIHYVFVTDLDTLKELPHSWNNEYFDYVTHIEKDELEYYKNNKKYNL